MIKTNLLKILLYTLSFLIVAVANAEDNFIEYSEAAFLKEILGQSEEKVVDMLGEPKDVVLKDNMKFWMYESVVTQGKTDKYFKYTQLVIINGIVQNVGNSNRISQ